MDTHKYFTTQFDGEIYFVENDVFAFSDHSRKTTLQFLTLFCIYPKSLDTKLLTMRLLKLEHLFLLSVDVSKNSRMSGKL